MKSYSHTRGLWSVLPTGIGTHIQSVMTPKLDNITQPEKADPQAESITDRHTNMLQSDPFQARVIDKLDLPYPMTATHLIVDNGTARQPELQSHTGSQWLIGKQPIHTPSKSHVQS